MSTKPIDTTGEWISYAMFWLEGLTKTDEYEMTPDVANSYLWMAIQCLENAKKMLT